MRVRWKNRVMQLALVAMLPLTLQACATKTVRPNGVAASFGPTLSVERFLNAANARDYETMASLFGTVQGPVAETGGTFGCAFKRMGSWLGMSDRCVTAPNVELRMDAIARILAHEDYLIRSEERVAGRNTLTTQVSVDIDVGAHTVREVPFMVVRSGKGDWLVQEIGLERLTS